MRKTMLVLASVALAVLVLGGVAWAATIQCRAIGTCWGTPKADTMKGNYKHNEMEGKAGGDTMYGRAGFDIILGDRGNDKMYGGPGGDVMRGERGVDRIYGGDGDDDLQATISHGREGIIGDNDYGDDYLHGGRGHDLLGGTSDDDSNYVQRGVDRFYGDEGNDDIRVQGNAAAGDSAKDIVYCGPGTDEVWFDEGVDVVNDTCEIKHPL
jgi:Ca2+-binding RTX toxin-like protein